MKLTEKTEVLVGKPVSGPLCPPQIPYALTRDQTTPCYITQEVIKKNKQQLVEFGKPFSNLLSLTGYPLRTFLRLLPTSDRLFP
jgi:hypothetical protein